MTTVSWTGPIDHTTNTGFRSWGSTVSAKFALAGLIQTSDTGQINWSTVNRAASNGLAGYEIWRMNDSAQATAPIFFRVEYRTGPGGSDCPEIRIGFGTGTNGSGTLTGTAKEDPLQVNYGYNTPTPSANFPSYLCVVDGFFGFSIYLGYSSPQGINASFFFNRTCDEDGVADDRGCFVHWPSGNGGTGIRCRSFLLNPVEFVYSAQNSPLFAFIPMPESSTFDGTNFQAYPHYTITPGVETVVGTCTVRASEVALGSTFTVAMVGTTVRTYVGLLTGPASGQGSGYAEARNNTTYNYSLAMLWE